MANKTERATAIDRAIGQRLRAHRQRTRLS